MQYFKDTVEEYNLADLICLRHRVDHAQWDEDIGRWTLKITNLEDGSQFEDQCDVFVNAMGFLNNWHWPDIEGLHDFKGTLAHSANYPPGLELKGKRVAVVGNGSSGIQIIATIQPEVAKLCMSIVIEDYVGI